MKVELKKAFQKQQRLLQQIDFVKNKQQTIINNEFRNIKNLKRNEIIEQCFFDLFVDLLFKQIVFFYFNNNVLLFTFLTFFNLKIFKIVNNS